MIRTQATASFSVRIKASLATQKACLTTEIEALTAELKAVFMANSRTKRIREIVVSVPGLADDAASVIIADLPEIGTLTRGELAALAGTAPMTQQSGQWHVKAKTKGRRWSLRSDLHMIAIVAVNHNPDLKIFAERLKARGKHSYAVITAVLRKLIFLLNTLVNQDRLWTKERP
jgi:transposase